MSKHEFGSTLHPTHDSMVAAIVYDWISAGGAEWIRDSFAEATDEELAADLADGWGLGEGDLEDVELEEIVLALADLRSAIAIVDGVARALRKLDGITVDQEPDFEIVATADDDLASLPLGAAPSVEDGVAQILAELID